MAVCNLGVRAAERATARRFAAGFETKLLIRRERNEQRAGLNELFLSRSISVLSRAGDLVFGEVQWQNQDQGSFVRKHTAHKQRPVRGRPSDRRAPLPPTSGSRRGAGRPRLRYRRVAQCRGAKLNASAVQCLVLNSIALVRAESLSFAVED